METGDVDLDWSNEFAAADWIRDRLHPFGQDVGSVIPDAFDAYVVLVHPNHAEHLPGDQLQRLARVLMAQTLTPDHLWYCVWEGYGQLHGGSAVSRLRRGRGRMSDTAGVVPDAVRDGGRVEFPQRSYYLYRAGGAGWSALAPSWLTPNIVWPDDRAWCVAREIDFAATYVGGPQEVVDMLRGDQAFTAISVNPSEPFEEGREFERRRR